MKKIVLATLAAGIWMNASEFIRNELLLKDQWVSGFESLGLGFPGTPINGMVWGLWAFTMCAVIVVLLKQLSVLRATIVTWVLGFVLMWVAMLNLGVFPKGLLAIAIPWSFIEVYGAAFIAKKVLDK